MRPASCLALVGFLALCTGCTEVSRNDGSTTYSYALWAPTVVIFGLIGAFILGLVLRRHSLKWGWGLIILSPLALIVLAPGMFMSNVVVNNLGFRLKTGFWFSPTEHSVRFADLKSIEHAEEVSTGRRGRKNHSYYLLCNDKAGSTEKMPTGDLMREGAAIEIVSCAKDQGVLFVDRVP